MSVKQKQAAGKYNSGEPQAKLVFLGRLDFESYLFAKGYAARRAGHYISIGLQKKKITTIPCFGVYASPARIIPEIVEAERHAIHRATKFIYNLTGYVYVRLAIKCMY
jgi:hypothetical protein